MQRTLLLALCLCAAVLLTLVPKAASGDTVFVANFGAQEIDKITSAGSYATFVSLPFPDSVISDSTGNLYVGCTSSQIGQATIQKVTPDGSVSTYATGLTTPTALAFDRNGNLYVGSEALSTVSKISPEGTVSPFATISDELEGLAFDNNGNLIVAGYHQYCYKVTPGGTVSLFADLGSGRAGGGLAFDGNNNLYVCDGGRIDKITPSGTISTFVTVPHSMDLAFDSQGNLFVASLEGGVKEFNASGGLIGSTQVQSPVGITVVTPEPATLSLLVVGGLTMLRRRR